MKPRVQFTNDSSNNREFIPYLEFVPGRSPGGDSSAAAPVFHTSGGIKLPRPRFVKRDRPPSPSILTPRRSRSINRTRERPSSRPSAECRTSSRLRAISANELPSGKTALRRKLEDCLFEPSWVLTSLPRSTKGELLVAAGQPSPRKTTTAAVNIHRPKRRPEPGNNGLEGDVPLSVLLPLDSSTTRLTVETNNTTAATHSSTSSAELRNCLGR